MPENLQNQKVTDKPVTDETPAEPVVHPSQQLREGIIAKRKQERDETVPPVDTNPLPNDPELDAAKKIAESVDPKPETDIASGEQELVSVKVFGEESMVSKAEVDELGGVKAYQMTKAAERRYQEAQELYRQNTALKHELEATRKREPEEVVPADPVEGVELTPEQKAKVESFREDYDDDFAEMRAEQFRLANLIERQSKQTSAIAGPSATDADAIAARATEQALSTMQHQQSIEVFKREYSDIAGDPALFQMADAKTLEIQAEHPDWRLPEILNEAGKRTREWVNNLKPDSDFEKKRAAKAKIGSGPSGIGARHTLPPPEPRKTARDVIADMRRSRGQPG